MTKRNFLKEGITTLHVAHLFTARFSSYSWTVNFLGCQIFLMLFSVFTGMPWPCFLYPNNLNTWCCSLEDTVGFLVKCLWVLYPLQPVHTFVFVRIFSSKICPLSHSKTCKLLGKQLLEEFRRRSPSGCISLPFLSYFSLSCFCQWLALSCKYGWEGGGLGLRPGEKALTRSILRDMGLGRREEGVPEVTRDKLSLPVNYIYVDWDLLQLSVLIHTHTMLAQSFARGFFVKPCLPTLSSTCFSNKPGGSSLIKEHSLWSSVSQSVVYKTPTSEKPGIPASGTVLWTAL